MQKYRILDVAASGDSLVASSATSSERASLLVSGGELSEYLGGEEEGADGSACNKEVPHISEADEVGLAHGDEVGDGELAEGSSDGAGAVDDAGDGAKGLVVALDGWVVGEIGSDGGGDDVVRAADQAAHEGEEGEEDPDVELVHVEGEDQQQRAEDAHERGNDARTTAAVEVGDPAADNAARHHTNGIEGGDQVGGRLVEVLGEEVRKLEEHGIVHLYGQTDGQTDGHSNNYQYQRRINEGIQI